MFAPVFSPEQRGAPAAVQTQFLMDGCGKHYGIAQLQAAPALWQHHYILQGSIGLHVSGEQWDQPHPDAL